MPSSWIWESPEAMSNGLEYSMFSTNVQKVHISFLERTVGVEPDLHSLEGCYLASKKPAKLERRKGIRSPLTCRTP